MLNKKEISYKTIQRLFTKLKCYAIVILKTPRARDLVDNGVGVEFELPEWVVIHDGKMSKKALIIYYKWTMDRNIKINKISNSNVDRCISLDGLIQKLNQMDGYEIVYKRKVYK